jgi:hypothetical protein
MSYQEEETMPVSSRNDFNVESHEDIILAGKI